MDKAVTIRDIVKSGVKASNNPKYAEWLKQCYAHSKKSNHPSTHNAAFLIKNGKVVLKGLNILPSRVKYKKERFEGANKHAYLNHAERDVIYLAARKGIKTENLTMIMPWLPCIPCANAIITSGIKLLIVHKQMIERTADKWKEELTNAIQILKEANVKVVAYDGKVGAKAYMHGILWEA